MNTLDLKRNLVPLKSDGEVSHWGTMIGRKYGGWLNWEELITHRRVVLLAEANSGKTAEFRLQVETLRERGRYSFFLRVEDLVDGALVEGLTPEDEARFSAWQTSSEQGWFFLDSVDEARLNAKSFERALKRFRRDVGAALDRAFIFVSCRVTDWKGKEDKDLVVSLLPVYQYRSETETLSVEELLLRPILKDNTPSSTKDTNGSDASESLTLVRLAELDAEQRSALARWAGVVDPDGFIREVNRQGLDTLAERPGDLLELAEYWKAHGRFASFAAMTEFAVVQKLSERAPDRPDAGVLTDVRAREGAERIAAGLTLGKSLTLRVPGQEPDPTLTAGALDPADVLQDWTSLERAALLRRGVFTPATYGRVRFHHRSTQEYLTAQWLQRLLRNGCTRSEVMGLLFAEPYGVRTAVPSMRPVAAWLALTDTEVRDELLNREPLELIRHGDPRSLPINTRARLLIVYADHQSAGRVTDENVDHRSFWMFADAGLAPAIRQAWERNADPTFRAHLLLIVREGVISDCLDLAREPAADINADWYVRYAAVAAMAACGDREGLARVVDAWMVDPSVLSSHDVASIALHLFPIDLTRSNLIRLIDETQPAHPTSAEGFPAYINEFSARCPADERLAFLGDLADLCLAPPFLSEYHRVSAKHSRLAPKLVPLALSVAQASKDAPIPPSLIKACAAIERSRENPDKDDLQSLRAALADRRDFHRALFWFDVQEARRNRERDVDHRRFLGVYGSHLWMLSAEDSEWLTTRVRDEKPVQDRQVALSALVSVLDEDALRIRAEDLWAIVRGTPELESDLATALSPRLPDRNHEQDARLERVRSRRDQRRQVKIKQSWINFANRIHADSTHLRDPVKLADWTYSSDLLTLTDWLSSRTGEGRQSGACRWPLLAEGFGSEAAEAYRAGMKLLWRVTAPRTMDRTPDEPKLAWTHLLSCYGIGLEAHEGEGWAGRLTGDEAERALRHVLSAGERTSGWIEALAQAHHDRIKPILAKQIAVEWAATVPVSREVLDGIASGGDDYLVQMADSVIDCLRKRAGRIDTFDIGLRIFARLPRTLSIRADLTTHAAHTLSMDSDDEEWALRQLALLFMCDLERGIQSLQQWLDSAESEAARKARGEKAFARLFSRHWPLVPDLLNARSVEMLKRLVLLGYRTIHIDNDRTHDGIYTPDQRDEAETARGRILETLRGIPGRETYEALLELADDASIASRRRRFRELAHLRAEEDSEMPAWLAADVVVFEKKHVTPAKTGSDLFRIACATLDDIQTAFLNEDASSRRVLRSAEDEEAVQQWLTEQLRLRSKGRFHVHREAEVADKKEPDILLSSTVAPVEVAVEVKHGGKKWTVRDLEAALRDQLSGQYLRTGNRRYGLLVITHHKEPRTWRDTETGIVLSFEQLVRRLRDLAATLHRNPTGPIEVTVVGLDASPRQ